MCSIYLLLGACQSGENLPEDGSPESALTFSPEEPPQADLGQRIGRLRLMSKDLEYGLLKTPLEMQKFRFRLADSSFLDLGNANALILSDRQIQNKSRNYGFTPSLGMEDCQNAWLSFLRSQESPPATHPLRLIRYLFILEGILSQEKPGFAHLSFGIWAYDTWENQFLGYHYFYYRSEYGYEQENPYPGSFCDSLKRVLYREFYGDAG